VADLDHGTTAMRIIAYLFRLLRLGKPIRPLPLPDHAVSGSQAPTPGPNFTHGFFAAMGWLVAVRESVGCIFEPYRLCHSFWDVIFATLYMPLATFIGVSFSVLVVVSSTAMLVAYLRGKLRNPSRD